jgi:hypothetical protein
VGRLFAIFPDVGKLLAVIALCEGVLCFIRPYFDGDVAEAREFEIFLLFCLPRQGYQEQRQVNGGTCLSRRPASV